MGWWIFGAVNILGFLAMGWDKRRAQLHHRRIRERDLLFLATCGGALGIGLGMYLWRHKTRHPKFTITIPLLLLIQVFLVAWLVLGIVSL